MSPEKSLTPQIRFKGFTEAWEQRKLGDIAEIIGGGTPDTNNPSYWDGDIDWYSPAELGEQIYAIGSRRRITEEGYKNSSAKLLPANKTILFTSRAGIGTTAILCRSACTNQGFQSLVINDNTDLYFIYSMSSCIKDFAISKASGSTFLEISGKQLATMNLFLPQLNEQRKIGQYFKSLDNLITLHQRKLDALKKIKSALLEKMFPKDGSNIPEIRFAGFTEAWEQRKLGDIAAFSKGQGFSKSNLTDSGSPVILYGRLYTNYETQICKVDTFVKSSSCGVLSKGGEVIVPASGETAEDIAVASHVSLPGILLGGDLNVVTPKDNLDSNFLALFITFGNAHVELSKRAQGKSVVHVRNGDLSQLNIKHPTQSEQILISNLFIKNDNLITLHQRELNALKKIKSALLEKMFI